MNKQKFLMATPAITREYTPGSRRNSRKALFNSNRLEKKADSQDSIEQVGQLSTSTSRGAFPEQHVFERDPDFSA